jgi:hypothetical protein
VAYFLLSPIGGDIGPFGQSLIGFNKGTKKWGLEPRSASLSERYLDISPKESMFLGCGLKGKSEGVIITWQVLVTIAERKWRGTGQF